MDGMFQCTKCDLVFSASPQPEELGGWHLGCPNLCTNKIKPDIGPVYYEPHKYFEWLNYGLFNLKGNMK